MASNGVQSPDGGIERNIGISGPEVHCIRYTWVIENFAHALLDRIGDEIISPDFGDLSTLDTTWRLELSRYYSPKVRLLSLSLRLLHSKQKALNVKCKVSIIDTNGNKAHTRFFRVPIRGFEVNNTIGWWDFISYNELMKNLDWYLLDNSLTLTCSIYIIGKNTVLSSETNCTMKIPESRLAEDFETLLNNPSSSDVVLSSDSKEYKCHKAILGARSPVFATMFEDGIDEKKNIKISGVEDKVLEEMLRFIYTGEVNDLEQIGLQLLYTADRYALDQLRAMCEKQLAQNISVDNAVEVLLYADKHCFKRLKRQAKRFLCRNMKRVLKTNSWKMLASTNGRLLNELISFCADHASIH